MKNGSESTTTTEIVCGLPVLVKARDRDKPVIRIKPKPNSGGKRKRHVEHPMALSRRERNELGIKQREALSNYFSGMTKKDAGIAAGWKESSAVGCVNNALDLAAGNALFIEAMEEKGITIDKLVDVLAEGLKATHPLSKENKKDYRTIHSYWHDAAKMRDGFPAARIKSESDHRHMHIHITADGMEGLDKYERMRREAIDASTDPY